MKKIIPIILFAALMLPVFFVHGCANTTQAPTGGEKDTIPPLVIDINPLPGAVLFPTHGGKIVFTFNEYVNVKTATNIFLSPPQKKAPKSKVSGKSVVVSFEDDLAPNTTYTLTFNDAIADNNENNMFAGFTYAFSTGERIDSMMITGTVQNSSTLLPTKGATVLLYKNHADSAVFLERPYAAAKTDDWGFFNLSFIQDTLYRLYAIKDDNNNNIYDPDTETIAFVDSLVKPVMVSYDTIPEMLKYDMKDTLKCLARKSEYELNLFREKPSKQYIVNKVRVSDRAAYITFMAPNAYIDSMWIAGVSPDRLITQFNIQMDSLEIWVNSRKAMPDTLHLYVDYRKTDTLGKLSPFREHIKLNQEGVVKKKSSRAARRDLKHEDTICVYTLNAAGETLAQKGFELEFKYPIIFEKFDSVRLTIVNTRQKESVGAFTVERDSMNIRKYAIHPKDKIQKGYEYHLKLPYRAFRDINGFYSDSTEVKAMLPTDEDLSTLRTPLTGVKGKIIVDLMTEKMDKVERSFIVDKDCVLEFPYLKEGKYCIRITDDSNRNCIVDTGNLLERRQPEKVRFVKFGGDKEGEEKFIEIIKSSELEQEIDVSEVLK